MTRIGFRLRSVLFLFLLWGSLPIFVPLLLLTWPLPARQRIAFSNLWMHYITWCLHHVGRIRARFQGLEHAPDGPAIYLVKHQSTFETFVLQTRFAPYVWVIKKQLLKIPLFGWGLAVINPIAIDRTAGSSAVSQVVEQGCTRLNNGLGVLIFPEGTRTAPGVKKRYKMGGGLLAEAAKDYPVIPVAHNAGLFWPPRQTMLGRPGVVDFSVGAPIHPAGLSAQQIVGRAETWIEAESDRLAQAPDYDPL